MRVTIFGLIFLLSSGSLWAGSKGKKPIFIGAITQADQFRKLYVSKRLGENIEENVPKEWCKVFFDPSQNLFIIRHPNQKAQVIVPNMEQEHWVAGLGTSKVTVRHEGEGLVVGSAPLSPSPR